MSDVAYEEIWSGGWDDMRRYGPMARHTRRLMCEITADLAPGSILDVGCGEGSLLADLLRAHPAAKGAGAEISENALALARRLLPGAAFHVLDIGARALPETYDLVTCADVIEHIPDDEAALRHMADMCTPGGRVVVATLQGRMRRFEADIGHQRNYARGELAAKMERAGLVVERVFEWGFPFYSPLYRDLLEAIGNRGTMGRFGPVKKMLSHLIYAVFLLNSRRHGDYIFIRARKGT
jgi:SAM-dependent methyltransferase